MYALKETNALVEEFMLLANITVGKKILRCVPTLFSNAFTFTAMLLCNERRWV